MTVSGQRLFLTAVGCVLLILLVNGRKQANHRVEAKVPMTAVSSLQLRSQPSVVPVLPPPTAEDVRQAVVGIYGDVLQMPGAASIRYMVGDFNGDGSQDLAVEARPARTKLPDLNDELANWILEDPGAIFVPSPSQSVQQFPPKPPRQLARLGQPVLVIVHGYGVQGWRSPAARQSYLLLNTLPDQMEVVNKGDVHPARSVAPPMPRLLGDVIYGKCSGHRGFLFWTGGHYAWHGL